MAFRLRPLFLSGFWTPLFFIILSVNMFQIQLGLCTKLSSFSKAFQVDYFYFNNLKSKILIISH